MPAFAPCPTCNAPPFQKGGGPVTHRHRPGCQTMRAERLACAECACPRPAGQALCDDCQRRAVATIDRAAEAPEVPRDAMLAALAEQAGLMRAVLRELQALRADLASVTRLADAAVSRPLGKPSAPGGGWTTAATPTPSDGVRRVELD